MNYSRIKLTILCLCAIIFMVGCHAPSDATLPATEPASTSGTVPSLSAAEEYISAIGSLQNLSDFSLEIDRSKAVTVGSETYRSSAKQYVDYRDFGTAKMCASVTETIAVGTLAIDIEECYQNETVYTTISGSRFSGSMDVKEYSSRYAPAILLSTELYDAVSFADSSKEIIHFQSAVQAEAWAVPQNASFQYAEGSATITSGCLHSSTYTISYSLGAAIIKETITVLVNTDAPSIDSPDTAAQYLPLENVDAIRILEQAYGNLISADVISATVNDSAICQAGGIFRGQTTRIHTYHQQERTMAQVEIDVSVTDYSKGGEITSYTQLENYSDGKYTVSKNGSSAASSDSVASEEMKTYCRDFLVNSLPMAHQIKNASITMLDSLMFIEYTCTDELAQIMCNTACTTLYENPYLLDQLSTETDILSIDCYLAIDVCTGLPTASGISYKGTHSIDGYVYELSYQIDQSYTLGDMDSYEVIAGTPGPVDDNTVSPTPLLYRISNESGKTMWLFGTTEVGDQRTRFLPSPVIDALQRSDALAVEFPFDKLQHLETIDSAFMQTVADTCYFTDETTLADHLKPEIYTDAVLYAKAAGLNNILLSRVKPVVLANSLHSFFVSRGYTLTSTNSAVNRLKNIANTLNRDIISICSAESQIQALTELSYPAQQSFLKATMDAGLKGTCDSTVTMYTFWCDGDEDALRKLIRDTLSQTDSEYVKLHKEHSQAITKEIAAYFDTDKTVFIAVDISLLFAPDGIVDALVSAGFSVEQVLYA